tara:strand:+ start:1762 stop:1974 length:213 start_codon:yes stop_codon:yes gene_type:complete
MTNKQGNSLGLLIMIIISILVMTILSSCGTSRLSHEEKTHRDNIDYELEKLYLEYSYKRDSLIIEFYRER